MNKLFFVFLLYLPVIFLSAQDIPAPPNPPRLVNDFANVLSDGEEQQLERKLVAYNDSTSTQITVVTVRNIGGYDVMDYAYRIGEQWGVGQKGKNNGLVVLVSIDDRKAGIATGYGMEGSITDLATRRIRENYMNPNFRNGDFYKGIDEATTAIMKLASGEFKADDLGPQGGGGGALIFLLLVFIIFIVIIVSAARRSQRNHYGTKGLDFWTALWLMMNAGGGGRGRGRGGNDGWGGWGGGSSGGGFGGFGGGGFGGGGSGGSW
jgi:uncharacterized protein